MSKDIIKPNLTYIGFNDFQKMFSFPINLAFAIITVFGAALAYIKFHQDNLNFQNQLNQNKDNIYINNYYRHQAEFIKYIQKTINSLNLPKNMEPSNNFFTNDTYYIENDHNKLKISDYTMSRLFVIWFGHINENIDLLSIKKDILDSIPSFYENYKNSRPRNIKDNFVLTDDLKNDLEKFGLFELYPDSHNKWENYSKLKIAISICKSILEFSGQSIENEIEIYEIAKL